MNAHPMKYVALSERVLSEADSVLNDEYKAKLRASAARFAAAASEQAHAYSEWRAIIQTIADGHVRCAQEILDATYWDLT